MSGFGGIHGAVVARLVRKQKVVHVNKVTRPGADGLLACGDAQKIESIKEDTTAYVKAHPTRAIAVVGYEACPDNRVSKEKHIEHIRKGMEVVKSWGLSDIAVIGMWVQKEPNGPDWIGEEIT